MEKQKEIDALVSKIEQLIDQDDSLFIIYVNSEIMQMSSSLLSNDPKVMVSAICENFDSNNNELGRDLADLFMSVILTYAKAHPQFATKFIQLFNKVMYGLEL